MPPSSPPPASAHETGEPPRRRRLGAAAPWLFLGAALALGGLALQRSPAPRAADPASPPRPWLLLAVPATAALALVGLRIRRNATATRVNARALQLLRAGELADAAEVFRALAQARFVSAAVKGVAAYNLAFALLRQGELHAAREALAAWGARPIRPRPLRALHGSLTSLCCALLGELDESARWAGVARAEVTASSSPVRLHLAAEAIVALRRGEPRAARIALEQGWAELERASPAEIVRGLRVASALAAEADGGAAPATVSDLLAGARPLGPGDLAWLGGSWPEMARYLEAKGFTHCS